MDNISARAKPPSPPRQWGPDRRLRWLSLAAAVGCLVWRIFDPNPENRLVAVTLAVVALLVTAALVRIRVRLAADAAGLTVVGPIRTRTIPWSDVDSISTPRNGRFGRRGATLEIDLRPPDSIRYDDDPVGSASAGLAQSGALAEADTELLAFGAFELGADPAAVGRALARLRAPKLRP